MDDSHTKSGEEVINILQTDAETGLDDQHVARAQEKYGPNGKLLKKYKQIVQYFIVLQIEIYTRLRFT